MTTAREFAVLLSRKDEVESAFLSLRKRAARKGIPGAFSWSWGKAYQSEEQHANVDGVPPVSGARLNVSGSTWIFSVARIPLFLEGEAPRLQGWRFVATLQHLDGENVVRTLPGEEIPASYRTRGSMCDHCRTMRRRNDTYILRHEDGRLMQVGSSCIRDFLGSDEAGILAAKAEMLALAASVALDDEGFGGGGGARERLMSDFLPVVAWVVRMEGWVSRTHARENGGEATADRAWMLLTDPQARSKAGYDPSEEDLALAHEAETWAEAIADEAIEKETSDYLHNLRAVARTGLVSYRTAGIAASAVTAYQRHLGYERAKAERAASTLNIYVGSIGEKVSFGLPAKLTKRGAPAKGAPSVLSSEPVTLDFVTGYSTDYGYTTVLKFRTKDGVKLVWKASNTELDRSHVGKKYTLVGTVKAHDEYKGEKQTVLSRCTVTEVEG